MIPLQALSATSSSVLAAGALIPYASLTDSARLVTNPQRERELPLPAAVAVKVVSRGLSAFMPTVIRGANAYFKRRRVSTHQHQQTLSLNPGQSRAIEQLRRELVHVFPRAQITSPLIKQALDLLAAGAIGELLSIVAQSRPYLVDFQRPILNAIMEHVARNFPAFSDREALAPDFLLSHLPTAAADIFRPDMFDKVNSRGLTACSEHLFGREPAAGLGVTIKPEDTTLWRMIDRLPTGAILADWGGGIGINALIAKLMRPDLQVYVNDLHGPEVLLENAMAMSVTRPEFRSITEYALGNPNLTMDRNGRIDGSTDFPINAAQLQSQLHYLIGDASRVTLPEGKQADLIIAASLSPYVPNPLGLFMHMYHQLKPNGIVASTITTEIRDADLDWSTDDKVINQFASDLAKQGIPVETTPNQLTLAAQRPDDSRLRLSAAFLESSLGAVRLPFSPFMNRYTSFYRPHRGQRRWVQRVEAP